MPIRKYNFVEDNFYHIYSRGNSKQVIFKDNADYARFIKLLFISNTTKSFQTRNINDVFNFDRGETLVNIGSYCLMPNHFHILLSQVNDKGVTNFMRKLLTSYSMYFNTKYKRTGSLFEGRFKSELADNDRYLKYLFSYIHLNPLKLIDKDWKEKGIKNKKSAVAYLRNYPFCSYQDYLGSDRMERFILSKKAFPRYFSKKNSFEEDVLSWINNT